MQPGYETWRTVSACRSASLPKHSRQDSPRIRLQKSRHACIRIELCFLDLAAIDDVHNVGDSDTGFGNIGRDHDLSPFSLGEYLFLLGVGQVRMKREDIYVADLLPDRVDTLLDLGYTGQTADDEQR